jgi:hypothetical protein
VRAPDLTNEAGTIRAWRLGVPEPGVGPTDWQAGLAAWFIDADQGVLDPLLGLFTRWYIGVVSLRDVPGVPPAYRQYPEAQYELLCFTIDPGKDITIEVYDRRLTGDLSGPDGFLLQPADIVFQWHGTDDAGAHGVLDAFIRAIVIGGLSPNRPVDASRIVFDADWRSRLAATVEHYATGHWPANEPGASA